MTQIRLVSEPTDALLPIDGERKTVTTGLNVTSSTANPSVTGIIGYHSATPFDYPLAASSQLTDGSVVRRRRRMSML